jgi:hypothetical protein
MDMFSSFNQFTMQDSIYPFQLLLTAGNRHAPMTLDNPLHFFAFFVLFWIAASVAVAVIGGWNELSHFYRSEKPFDGRRWYFRSGRMRWNTKYSGCLMIGANAQGLYLAAFILFRVGHPPLFIPWQDISANTGKTLWWKWTEYRFRLTPTVWLRIYGNLSDEIKSTAGPFCPNGSAVAKD